MVRCNSAKDAHPADGTDFIQHKTRQRRQAGSSDHLFSDPDSLSMITANPVRVGLTQSLSDQPSFRVFRHQSCPWQAWRT